MKCKRLLGVVFLIGLLAIGCSSSSDTASGSDSGSDGGAGERGSGQEIEAGDEAATYSISGKITGGAIEGVKVTLGGVSGAEATTDAAGNYSFTGLSAGDYTVTPTKDRSVFNPVNAAASISSANSEINFTSAAYQEAAISSTAAKDGSIGSCPDGELPYLNTAAVGRKNGGCGDDGNELDRLYLYFDLSGLSTSATFISAFLSFTQSVTGTPYTSGPLAIDEVDYGDTLSEADWAGLTVLTQSIASNQASTDGAISIGTDLLSYVQADLAGKKYMEFRLRFSDDVGVGSYVAIESPTLTVTYYQF